MYLFRWQLSTPILAPIVACFTHTDAWTKESWIGATVANLIGGLIFFWVDKYIFTSKIGAIWQVRENVTCADCGWRTDRGYRLVRSIHYDKTNGDAEYRCEQCSMKKAEELKIKGIDPYR